jgi:hypothetical protein
MQVHRSSSHTLTVYFHKTYFQVTCSSALISEDCYTHIHLEIPQEFDTRFLFMLHMLQINTLSIQ